MDITRAILDGIAMAAIFNGAVAAFVLINPRFFFDSYPKKIQNSAPEKMTKDDKRREKNKFNTYDYNFRNRIYIWSDLSFTYGDKRT